MTDVGYMLLFFYLLPFVIGFAKAWNKNIALYLALAPCTLLLSWFFFALYVTMALALLLPWLLLWFVV